MDPEFGTPISPDTGNKKNVWLIVAVVAVILLCCCCVVGGLGTWLWNNGDDLLYEFGLALQLTALAV